MYKKISEATHYKSVKERMEKIVIYLENNLNEIEHLLSLPANQDRFDACLNFFYPIIDNIPLVVNYLSNIPIIRARPNYNEEVFSEDYQISYNSRNKGKIKAGRFNDIEEPIFYGCLPVKNEGIDQGLSASLESCKELISIIDAPKIQDMTLSEWVIKTPFPVINLCFNDEHLKGNPEIKKVFDDYILDLRENFSPQVSRFIQRFLVFISDLSSSNKFENCYYVLTALFKVIDYYFHKVLKQPFHGIIYPSAMSESKGLNIALLPKTVDDFLYPNHVIMFRYFKVKDELRYVSYPISDVAKVNNRCFELRNFLVDQTKHCRYFY